ncbi:MAG TPA: nickel insertion protein, partial [Dehalococcoidia bacterium]|nr:nickel insertion protein [Dehalococcoidia bacterium]
ELLAHARDALLAAGAADAWLTPIQMKKGRPAVALSALCTPELADCLIDLILRETSTLGVRVRDVLRYEAEREELAFQSSLGPARAKVKRIAGAPLHVAPEFEDCRRLAESSGLPLREVYRIVEAEAQALLESQEVVLPHPGAEDVHE